MTKKHAVWSSNQPCLRNLGARLDAYRGWTSGFDYLRVLLAIAVIGWHSVFTSYGGRYEAEVYTSWIRPIIYPILPMFFSLGGFLVTSSLLRTKSFEEYLLLRVLRFFPALLAVVIISACVVGPLLTSERLSDYFNSPHFAAYFLNAFGYFEAGLPGVFLDNPTPGPVNVSLWTIPWEFGCSVVLYALMLCREDLRGRLLLAASILAGIAIPLVAILSKHEASIFARPPGHLLVMSFVAGVCFYFFRYKIALNFGLFVLCCVLTYVALLKGRTSYLAPVPITYLTIYLGVLNPPKYGLMKRADLSYGMYLYGALVQQSLVSLFPALRIWWLNWTVSASLAALCAAGSWYAIEEPILNQKKQIIARLKRPAMRSEPTCP